jgi:hypothetical protein
LGQTAPTVRCPPSVRWLLILALVAAPVPAHADDGAKLLAWYGKRAHWKKVRRQVLKWHGTTSNACVAFLSTAMRDVGLDVPRDAQVDGESVSRLTRPFSRWLEEHLGWSRISELGDLAPGDVVFTEHAEYPWHVFVFDAWVDEDARIALVLDNHGFLKRRPLLGDEAGQADVDNGAGVTPFAYALRAPP